MVSGCFIFISIESINASVESHHMLYPATSVKFRIFAAYCTEAHTGMQNLLPCSWPLKDYWGACLHFPNVKACGPFVGDSHKKIVGLSHNVPQIPGSCSKKSWFCIIDYPQWHHTELAYGWFGNQSTYGSHHSFPYKLISITILYYYSCSKDRFIH